MHNRMLTLEFVPESDDATPGGGTGAAGTAIRRYRIVDGDVAGVPLLRYRENGAAHAATAQEPKSDAADVRIYRQIESPDVGRPFDDGIIGDFLLCVWWTPDPVHIDDFHQWYWDEHIPALMSVDGWLRIRRFQTVSGRGPAYLAVHDLASIDVFDNPAYGPAVNTPWRDRVTRHRQEYDRGVFRYLSAAGG